jgi:hypothetical protein
MVPADGPIFLLLDVGVPGAALFIPRGGAMLGFEGMLFLLDFGVTFGVGDLIAGGGGAVTADPDPPPLEDGFFEEDLFIPTVIFSLSLSLSLCVNLSGQ